MVLLFSNQSICSRLGPCVCTKVPKVRQRLQIPLPCWYFQPPPSPTPSRHASISNTHCQSPDTSGISFPYLPVASAKKKLEEAGFVELREKDQWKVRAHILIRLANVPFATFTHTLAGPSYHDDWLMYVHPLTPSQCVRSKRGRDTTLQETRAPLLLLRSVTSGFVIIFRDTTMYMHLHLHLLYG